MKSKAITVKQRIYRGANSTMNDLIGALLDGDQEQAAAEAEKLLSENYKKEAVVKDGIEAAMKKLDAKCTAV